MVLATTAGLALGSYAVTAGLRLARHEGSTRGRSRCDACARELSFTHTVPVASYVWLRGACVHCGSRINPIHLVGEIAGAVVAVSAAMVDAPLTSALVIVLGLSLISAATVDALVQRLPDPLTLVVAVAALGIAAQRGRAALLAGLAAAVAVVAILMLIRIISRRSRGDPGLGLGDVKLVAAMALWLGMGTPLMVAGAALGGLAVIVVRRRQGRLPFGPFIAMSGWAVGISGLCGWTP